MQEKGTGCNISQCKYEEVSNISQKSKTNHQIILAKNVQCMHNLQQINENTFYEKAVQGFQSILDPITHIFNSIFAHIL